MNKYIVLNITDLNSFYLKEVYFNKLIDYYKDLNDYEVIIISKVYKDSSYTIYETVQDFIYNKEGMYLYFNNPTLIYNIDELNKIFNLIYDKKNIKIYKNSHFIGIGRIINYSNVLPYIYNSNSFIYQIISNKSICILNNLLQKYINNYHINNNVNIFDPKNTYISYHSKIDKNTTILPFSYIIDSKVGKNCTIGPHVTIRNNSIIKDNCRIGNFVEIKKSYINDFTKIAHLSYIGDSVIGKNVNIGCGVVTCNYDGFNKHQTIIKDNSFIGSNVNLIAPIVIGSNCYIAAGSTIYNNVDDYEFVIERGKQVNKKEYAKKFPYIKNTSTI
mgnify:CR=1 FL=1